MDITEAAARAPADGLVGALAQAGSTSVDYFPTVVHMPER